MDVASAVAVGRGDVARRAIAPGSERLAAAASAGRCERDSGSRYPDETNDEAIEAHSRRIAPVLSP
jgi:hypothetical protein